MILYHVTRNLLHDGTFYPRVPISRLDSENQTIERVCLSSSIEGCLSAMPGGGLDLDEFIGETNGILRVFELHIPDEVIDGCLYPDELKRKGYVPDAHITDEHWILEPFEATSSYLIQITEWKLGEKPTVSDKEREMWGESIVFVENITYTSSTADIASVHVPYPGDEEWKDFLRLGRQITGKGMRKRKDNRYCTEKCGEEFFFLAANFGTNISIPFTAKLGQSTIPLYGISESYKLWNGMIIFRDVAF